MEYAHMLHRCFRCGWCKLPGNYHDFNCPSYLRYRFESFSAGGRLWLIRAWLEGEIEASQRLAQILFSCVTCKNCVETCALPKIRDDLVDAFIAARGLMVEQGFVPPTVRDYLTAVYNHGNPFKLPRKKRTRWATDLGLHFFHGHEYLFYVDDVGAYDPLGMEMARDVAAVLSDAGVSFGILGEDQVSDGNDVRSLGETELFEHLAARNIADFRQHGVRKIITLSPHAYHTFKNDYPPLGGVFEVYHYTQILALLLDRTYAPGPLPARVAFHDPCYLGRWNGDYWTPRMILKAMPGLKVVELDRSMQNALCCGGGGGNFFTDMLGGDTDSAARVRVREALAAGAEILAVACPICRSMLDAAVRSEGASRRLRITDPAALLRQSRA